LSPTDELLRVWSLSNRVNLETSHPIQEILSVDAVSIRPMITIYEKGEIESIEDFTKFTSLDLFIQFVLHPRKFQEFIHQHWDAEYSSLFVHQVHPLSPELPYCAVHVVNARNGKGNQQTVEKLEEITEILDTKGFQIMGSAFDGDSCFNQLHCQFQQHWNIQTFDETTVNMFFNRTSQRLMISDPLHILKHIRYRFLSRHFRIRVGNDKTKFCIDQIRNKLPLPSIVYNNSRITNMHDSLAFELFSQASVHTIFQNCLQQASFAFFPWFLMISGLTGGSFFTKTRCHMFETAFWLLFFYQMILERYVRPADTTEKPTANKFASLYTSDQLPHTLSTLYGLIVILRDSSCPVSLNRVRSNPLEHLFGKKRLRCRDVNTSKRFLIFIGADFLKTRTDHLSELIRVSKRRNVVGLDCEPWTVSSDSLFTIKPIDIAVKFLMVDGLPINNIYQSEINWDSG
jgi:predicted transposase YbfD/YdcC